MSLGAPISGDAALVARLRDGDEVAFARLVDELTPVMRRLARGHVPSDAVADEVVQEAWLGVLRGLDRFEGRSTLKTWILRVVINRAKSRGARERRTVPFAALVSHELDEGFRAVDPDRFLPADHARAPGHWATPPRRWDQLPEEALINAETVAVVMKAIAGLPPAQRLVISLRDVEGFAADEVCTLLDLSPSNQRVLLHRARSRVRARIERHLVT